MTRRKGGDRPPVKPLRYVSLRDLRMAPLPPGVVELTPPEKTKPRQKGPVAAVIPFPTPLPPAKPISRMEGVFKVLNVLEPTQMDIWIDIGFQMAKLRPPPRPAG